MLHFLNYHNYDLFRFFMIILLESSLIINQLLYKYIIKIMSLFSINVYNSF